jgi:hypothetical protein
MMLPAVLDNAIIGSPKYAGLTLGGILEYDADGTFEKADYPALRAIRIGNTLTLVDALADSEDITLEPATGITTVAFEVFTSSDTFTKADYPGLVSVLFECQGGGGGGGGCALTGAGVAAMAGGGAGGAYARSLVPEADLAATEAITVGGGGGGGGAGANPGSAGGDSVVDTISGEVRAEGGSGGGGSGAAAASGSTGRTAGSVAASAGQLLIAGEDGHGSLWRNAGVDLFLFPSGGASYFGQHRGSGFTSNAGAGGLGGSPYGGGGSGAYNFPSQAARPGGDGAAGVVVATVYAAGAAPSTYLELLY